MKQDVNKNTNNRTRIKHEPGQITKKNNKIIYIKKTIKQIFKKN